jgi:alpha-D-glucose phosphate-specific phosphoglucomutase
MKKDPIKFGTSGYRGIINVSFTVQHVKAIALAIKDIVRQSSTTPSVAIGYDPREGNSRQLKEGSFTKTLVDNLTANGVNVHFFDDYAPTPLISWYITYKKLTGGLILTASHNPPTYNGIKYNPSDGAPAPKHITSQIETYANQYMDLNGDSTRGDLDLLKKVNLNDEFAAHLVAIATQYCNTETLSLSENIVSVDAKFGAVAKTWIACFDAMGISNYTIINKEPRSDFGNIEPNPTNYEGLIDLQKDIREKKSVIGIANDPDGDRHLILDENGTPLTPEETALIIFEYLNEIGKPVDGIASTVASSSLLKKVMDENKKSYYETEVGFKYFSPFFKAAADRNQICLGVESSGGFSTSFHTREKCGFLPGILLLMILSKTRKSLSTLKSELNHKYGSLVFLETKFSFSDAQKTKLNTLLKESTSNSLAPSFTHSIRSLNQIDGLKINLENGWCLIRLSGTEPIARIYAESETKSESKNIVKEAEKFLENSLN